MSWISWSPVKEIATLRCKVWKGFFCKQREQVQSLKLTIFALENGFGWKTILFFWVSAYFQGRLLLVSGSVKLAWINFFDLLWCRYGIVGPGLVYNPDDRSFFRCDRSHWYWNQELIIHIFEIIRWWTQTNWKMLLVIQNRLLINLFFFPLSKSLKTLLDPLWSYHILCEIHWTSFVRRVRPSSARHSFPRSRNSQVNSHECRDFQLMNPPSFFSPLKWRFNLPSIISFPWN